MPDTTFNYSVAMGAKLASAMGKRLKLGRPATEAEIKAETISFWRSVVRDQERLDAVSAHEALATSFDAT
jgi:hypothetical protein